MAQYLALIRKEADTSFGVDFPDFPGCVSGGETQDVALRNAAEALAVHIEGMVEDGEALPQPSDLETVMADQHNRGAVAVLVPAPPVKGRAVRINITGDENLLAEINRAAADGGMTRSGFFTASARSALRGTALPTKVIPVAAKAEKPARRRA